MFLHSLIKVTINRHLCRSRGTLSTYALMLMLFSFLQRRSPPILPTYKLVVTSPFFSHTSQSCVFLNLLFVFVCAFPFRLRMFCEEGLQEFLKSNPHLVPPSSALPEENTPAIEQSKLLVDPLSSSSSRKDF